jgi:hypothetical protein
VQASLSGAVAQQHELSPGGKFGPQSGVGKFTERLHKAYLDMLARPEYWDTFIALPRGAAQLGV